MTDYEGVYSYLKQINTENLKKRKQSMRTKYCF